MVVAQCFSLLDLALFSGCRGRAFSAGLATTPTLGDREYFLLDPCLIGVFNSGNFLSLLLFPLGISVAVCFIMGAALKALAFVFFSLRLTEDAR